MRPLSSNCLTRLLMILASCGPYLGTLQQTGETSPVSMRHWYPRIWRRRPSGAKTSQYFLIRDKILGWCFVGHSPHLGCFREILDGFLDQK